MSTTSLMSPGKPEGKVKAGMPRAVFFDLDGTFADTAPDLGAALNQLLSEEGRTPLPLASLRPFVSQGVRGMLKIGFGMKPEHPDYREYYKRFIAHYERNLCVHTTLFDGMTELLDAIEGAGMLWGIVTNKSQRFALPLMDALGYARRADCIVSGDSSPHFKPHPHPLHLACALTGIASEDAVFIGDDLRDILSGKAARMPTIAALYGYLGDGAPAESWEADHQVAQVSDIQPLIFRMGKPADF